MESDASVGSDDGDGPPEKCHLRFVDVLTEVPDGDASAATELWLVDRGLTSIESLEACKSLRKIELRGNQLTEVGFLEMNHSLCWLNLANNRFRRIAHLQNLVKLAVLDISDNRIVKLEGLTELRGLKTLICARNRLTRLDGLSPKKNPALETLIVSNNQIVECSLPSFPSLRKLSFAHNKLHACPQWGQLSELAELRLNSNRISSLPEAISSLPNLSILDIGNNLFTQVQSLAPLRGLLHIKSLTILGNALSADMDAEELKSFLATLPKLEIINNKRQSGVSNKKKRKLGGTDSGLAGRGHAGLGSGHVDPEKGSVRAVATIHGDDEINDGGKPRRGGAVATGGSAEERWSKSGRILHKGRGSASGDW